MIPIEVIGLGSGPADMNPATAKLIAQAEVLVGGRRLLALYPDHPAERLTITKGLDQVIAEIKDRALEGRKVVVLASGDPGFYGIGQRLVGSLGQEYVNVHPNLTMVQILASKLKLAWEEALVISLHGRGIETLDILDEIDRPVFIYTDPVHSPTLIGRWLSDRGQPQRRLVVAEEIGLPEERMTELSALEASGREFKTLNLVLIKPPSSVPAEPVFEEPAVLGNPDSEFAHTAGLITKAEIRSVALGLLSLRPGVTMWDLGAGSGSVAIEAAGLIRPGAVIAVEKMQRRVVQIRDNARRFERDNVIVRQMTLPSNMGDLPDPDRVFVGGGGKDLPEILGEVGNRLKPAGVVVVSVATIEALAEGLASLEKHGLSTTATQVQLNRLKVLDAGESGRHRLNPINPVFLIRGQR